MMKRLATAATFVIALLFASPRLSRATGPTTHPSTQPSTQAANDEASDEMKTYAKACLKAAHKAYSVELDYSPASIRQIEDILRQMHDENRDTGITQQRLALRCKTIGAYMGEVIRHERGGHWEKDSEFGEDTFPLVLPSGTKVFTIAWAEKRILNGSEDEVVSKFSSVMTIDREKK